MAAWNDKQFNSQTRKCPVCPCFVANKKYQKHVIDCYERNREAMESVGVIQCPVVSYHIMPVAFLDHHLDGNCHGVFNLLRKFYQKEEMYQTLSVEAPPSYDPGIPEKYLSKQNKNLLYMIDTDIYGYVHEERAARARQTEEAAAEAAATAPQADVD